MPMNSSTAKPRILGQASPAKTYGSSALLASRHFHFVRPETRTLDLSDAFRDGADIEAVAVVDDAGRPLGIVTREGLFALLAKPFAREILGRSLVPEVMEAAPVVDAHMSLFAAAGVPRAGDSPWLILADAGGAGGESRFRGLLSLRDLSDYLSQMTQDDIELAGSIQARLEESNEEIGGPGLAVVAWSRAAKGVGGDFWFAKRLEDGRVFLCLCDVSGKGVAASLVVSMVWGMLAMYDFRGGLEKLLIKLNESLISTFRLERYLTGFFGIYDAGSRELAVADMGHSHSLLVRGGRALRLKGRDRNLPLGVEAALEPRLERWRLEEGDALFVYSDGLTEQEDAAGKEFGEARLAATLAACLSLAVTSSGGAVTGSGDGATSSGPATGASEGDAGARLREEVPRALDLYRGRIPQQDDMSFMCLFA
jgi:sigma-B regulation protein RsbU (phosphoserine phosphatase)